MSLLASATSAAVHASVAFAAIPNPTTQEPPGFGGVMSILGWAKWAALAVCVVALIAVGALMALPSRRSEGGEHAGNVGKVLLGVVTISAAASLVGFLAT